MIMLERSDAGAFNLRLSDQRRKLQNPSPESTLANPASKGAQ